MVNLMFPSVVVLTVAIGLYPVTRIDVSAETLHVNAAQVYLAKHRVSVVLKQELKKVELEWEAKAIATR